MKAARGDRLLNWGFALALTLHAVALACAARLPTEVGGQDLSDIRVFDTWTSEPITAVDLVSLPAQGFVEISSAPSDLDASAAVRQKMTAAVLQAPTPRQDALDRSGPKPRPSGRTSPVGQDGAGPGGHRRREAAPQAGGGGGGGPADLGTPSPAGDLAGAASGGTPMGDVAGAGAGVGSGLGSGSSGGSGGGSGGGVGTGSGTGTGTLEGSGAGGSGEGGDHGGFTSRVADRNEPVVIHKGTLEYPQSAVSEGVEGTAKLQVLVTERGTVAEVTVAQSSHDRRLDAAAIDFVRGWRYQPAVQDGKPRRVYTYAVVTFELK